MDALSVLQSVIVLCTGLLLMPCAIYIAKKTGFTDNPDDARKVHNTPIPPAGGLVVFPLFIIFSVVFLSVQKETLVLFACIFTLLCMGAYDDKRAMSAWPKFFMQIAVSSVLVILTSARVYYLGDLFGLGEIGMGVMTIPFSITATVLLVNAINLLDGLDGLSSGVGLIILGAILFAHGGAESHIFILMICLFTFFLYNARLWPNKKAVIFFGDSGSLALGLAIAYFGMAHAGYKDAPLHPMSLAWILAFPIYDTCGQFGRRMKNGKHPFTADQHHFHHQLVKAGFSVTASVAIIWVLVILTATIGVFGYSIGVPLPILTLVWIAGLLAHIYMCFEPRRYENILKAIKR